MAIAEAILTFGNGAFYNHHAPLGSPLRWDWVADYSGLKGAICPDPVAPLTGEWVGRTAWIQPIDATEYGYGLDFGYFSYADVNLSAIPRWAEIVSITYGEDDTWYEPDIVNWCLKVIADLAFGYHFFNGSIADYDEPPHGVGVDGSGSVADLQTRVRDIDWDGHFIVRASRYGWLDRPARINAASTMTVEWYVPVYLKTYTLDIPGTKSASCAFTPTPDEDGTNSPVNMPNGDWPTPAEDDWQKLLFEPTDKVELRVPRLLTNGATYAWVQWDIGDNTPALPYQHFPPGDNTPAGTYDEDNDEYVYNNTFASPAWLIGIWIVLPWLRCRTAPVPGPGSVSIAFAPSPDEIGYTTPRDTVFAITYETDTGVTITAPTSNPTGWRWLYWDFGGGDTRAAKTQEFILDANKTIIATYRISVPGEKVAMSLDPTGVIWHAWLEGNNLKVNRLISLTPTAATAVTVDDSGDYDSVADVQFTGGLIWVIVRNSTDELPYAFMSDDFGATWTGPTDVS